MASKKRPYAEMASSDDDEDPTLGRQILPVARLPADFSDEPTDGMQYLFMVRRAAEKLPFISHVANPYQPVTVKTATTQPKGDASLQPKAKIKLPSEEWKETFLRRFRNFRKNMVQPTIGVQLPFIPSQGHTKLMPGWTERDNWWAYINGRPEYEWDPPRLPKKKRRVWDPDIQRLVRPDDVQQFEVPYTNEPVESFESQNIAGPSTEGETLIVTEYDEVLEEGEVETSMEMKVEEGTETEAVASHLPTPSTTPQPETRPRSADHRPPTMALLREMNNRFSLKLLQFFSHWINRYLDASDTPLQTAHQSQLWPPRYITQNHSRWIFALLTRVDDRLLSDELNELRNLARATIRYLKDIKKGPSSESEDAEGVEGKQRWAGDVGDAPMDEAACWMTITAVAEFWGQKDLWMDAETALR